MKRISEFFAVVAASKQPAIEETSSNHPIDAETQSSDKTDQPEAVMEILDLASTRLGMTNIGKRHSLS